MSQQSPGNPGNPAKPSGPKFTPGFTPTGVEGLPRAAGTSQPNDEGHRIMKLDAQAAPSASSVDLFSMPDLRKQRAKVDYAAVKSKYGPLAATDKERAHRGTKDKRFSLNSTIRASLSVEEEENRVIDERVAEKIAQIEHGVRAAAEKRGFEEGYEVGKSEANAWFRNECTQRLASLDEFLKSAEAAKEALYKANERYLMELMFRVARMVVLREIKTDKDYLLRLSRSLIEKTGARDCIRVRVSSEDMPEIQALREGLIAAFGEMRNLDIRASADVQRGGCVVETDWNSIDASIETQLQAISRAMTGDAQ